MKKIKVLLIVFLAITLTGCTQVMKTEKNKSVIYKETGQALTKNILCQPSNPEVIKLYTDNKVNINQLPVCESYKINDGGYEGLWTSIFVKPLAWLIIQIGKFVNNYGFAVVLTGILIRAAVIPITKKTAIQSENMKLAKPELDRLEKKYPNKNNTEEMNKKTQEMMMIYKKFKINPLSGCLLAFIQLPLFFAFLEAVNRVPAIFENKFLTLQMGTTPLVGISHGNYLYVLLILLIIVTTYFSFNYTMKDQAETNKQMQLTTRIMIIVITFASFSLPAAIALYWITSSAFTIVQNVLVKRKKVKNEVL